MNFYSLHDQRLDLDQSAFSSRLSFRLDDLECSLDLGTFRYQREWIEKDEIFLRWSFKKSSFCGFVTFCLQLWITPPPYVHISWTFPNVSCSPPKFWPSPVITMRTIRLVVNFLCMEICANKSSSEAEPKSGGINWYAIISPTMIDYKIFGELHDAM